MLDATPGSARHGAGDGIRTATGKVLQTLLSIAFGTHPASVPRALADGVAGMEPVLQPAPSSTGRARLDWVAQQLPVHSGSLRHRGAHQQGALVPMTTGQCKTVLHRARYRWLNRRRSHSPGPSRRLAAGCRELRSRSVRIRWPSTQVVRSRPDSGGLSGARRSCTPSDIMDSCLALRPVQTPLDRIPALSRHLPLSRWFHGKPGLHVLAVGTHQGLVVSDRMPDPASPALHPLSCRVSDVGHGASSATVGQDASPEASLFGRQPCRGSRQVGRSSSRHWSAAPKARRPSPDPPLGAQDGLARCRTQSAGPTHQRLVQALLDGVALLRRQLRWFRLQFSSHLSAFEALRGLAPKTGPDAVSRCGTGLYAAPQLPPDCHPNP